MSLRSTGEPWPQGEVGGGVLESGFFVVRSCPVHHRLFISVPRCL